MVSDSNNKSTPLFSNEKMLRIVYSVTAFSCLTKEEQEYIIFLEESLLSEHQSASAAHQSIDCTKKDAFQ